MSKSLLPLFPPRSSLVSGLTFKSLYILSEIGVLCKVGVQVHSFAYVFDFL